ncbi:MAG: hypothetical protein CSA38_02945 [Flavobacteriales bacterium]|nr:MAG: hypothetical protein CSA38_02945 [Flavobacteriales bacterium]
MASFLKNNFSNYLWVTLFTIGIFFIFYLFLYRVPLDERNLLKNTKYTLAIVTSDWHYKDDSGVGVDYEYFINDKYYYKTSNIRVRKGEKYIIVYDSLNPNTHCLLNNYELSDTIIPPKNGWKYNEVPIPIDSAYIRNIIR